MRRRDTEEKREVRRQERGEEEETGGEDSREEKRTERRAYNRHVPHLSDMIHRKQSEATWFYHNND